MNQLLERVPEAIEAETVSLDGPDNLDRLLGLLERARVEHQARAYRDARVPYRAMLAAIEAAELKSA